MTDLIREDDVQYVEKFMNIESPLAARMRNTLRFIQEKPGKPEKLKEEIDQLRLSIIRLEMDRDQLQRIVDVVKRVLGD